MGYVRFMGMDCLLVLREPKLQYLMTGVLAGLEIDAHVAFSAREAFEAITQAKFDAVVVDCCEFDDGADLIRNMRQLSQKTIAFAILPAETSRQQRSETQAHFVVQQPLSIDLLARSLRAARSMMLQERRRHFRYPMEVLATLESLHAVSAPELELRTTNLSSGGIAVAAHRDLRSSWSGKIRFDLPKNGGRIEAHAETAWLLAGRGAGLRFTQISDKHRTAIEQWISARVVEDQARLSIDVQDEEADRDTCTRD